MPGIYITRYFFCILLLTACTDSNNTPPPQALDEQVEDDCVFCSGSFWITHFTRTHLEGALEHSKVRASLLTKRLRQGQFMQFSNYDELYMEALWIDQLVKTKLVIFDMTELSLLANSYSPPANNEIVTKSDSKLVGNTLNRVLVDQITINFKPVKAKRITLAADHAKMLTDTMIMQFQGNVSLKAAKCKIFSDIAIWSNEHDGLFLPEAYQWNNKTYQTHAFFQITNRGLCKKIKAIHSIQYHDNLDAIENKIAESIPMPIRLLFGLINNSADIAQLQSAGE